MIEGPADIAPGSVATFRAMLTYTPDTRGRTRDVSAEAAWSSSNPAVLTVDRGIVTAHAGGAALLDVRLPDGSHASRQIFVGAPGNPAPPPDIAVGSAAHSHRRPSSGVRPSARKTRVE